MCSFCQSLRYPAGSDTATGRWLRAEEYYRAGGDSRVRISHTICPACNDGRDSKPSRLIA